jgi:outer membrane protein OmpA-like peptidoglycan-associated protein
LFYLRWQIVYETIDFSVEKIKCFVFRKFEELETSAVLSKKITLLFLFLLSGQILFGQNQNSRNFSITPYFGLGMTLPGSQQRISGGEWMRYQYKVLAMGQSVDATGKRGFDFRSTNRIGLLLNYRIVKFLEMNLGAERINLLKAYIPSMNFQFNGRSVGDVHQNLSYISGSAGLTFYTSNLYFRTSFQYIPDIFRNARKVTGRNPGNTDSGNFVNENGEGFKLSDTDQNQIKGSLYFSVGQEINLGDSPASLEIGLNYSPQHLFKEQINFYQNNNVIAENRINHGINAVFVTLSQTLHFEKKKEEKISQKKRKKISEQEELDVADKHVRIGEQVVLENIQFERSKAAIDELARAELDKVYDFMMNYPKSRIEISGHTSEEGHKKQNLRLSERRAMACKSYLVDLGISSKRIKAAGYGSKRLISETNSSLNRRVELRILSLGEE